MKRSLFILLIVLSVLACKKDGDVNPQGNNAQALLGTYTLNSITLKIPSDNVDFSLERLPIKQGGQTLSGKVNVTKGTADNLVNMDITVTDGTDESSIPLEDIEIRPGSKAAQMYLGSTLCGDATASDLIFNLSSGGDKLAFVASR